MQAYISHLYPWIVFSMFIEERTQAIFHQNSLMTELIKPIHLTSQVSFYTF